MWDYREEIWKRSDNYAPNNSQTTLQKNLWKLTNMQLHLEIKHFKMCPFNLTSCELKSVNSSRDVRFNLNLFILHANKLEKRKIFTTEHKLLCFTENTQIHSAVYNWEEKKSLDFTETVGAQIKGGGLETVYFKYY